MTFAEFLQAAQKLEGWYTEPLRSVRRRRANSDVECPLTAVANAGKGQRDFGIGDFEAAARYLGIHVATANAIVIGADHGMGKYGAALQALVVAKDDEAVK